ncbi:spore germination protein [Cohnella zeiphila]|uniref:Spore germination protein n=1 Tax=Cohnella zeiphila TaxID=2761120 RepID=A0A7X0SKN6_9BACL|nr:spore germination protein [Cohnella zeiphila]MBB6731762.1 spore germination protein [Cohnella zeiphila]
MTAETERALTGHLAEDVEAVVRELGDSCDLVVRELTGKEEGEPEAAVVYMKTMVDEETVMRSILDPLMDELDRLGMEEPGDAFRRVHKDILRIGTVNERTKLNEVLCSILDGDTVVLIAGKAGALAASTIGGESRAVEEPTSQTVTRGPKESFTENLQTNVSLVRRRIRSPLLRVEAFKLGRHTQTNACMIYMQNIAQPKVVQEFRQRLGKIDVDSILDSGYVEELIQDATWTSFPTLQNTERPDAACGAVMEGKVLLIVDGTPFALLAPVTFISFFQSSEDYYQRYDISTFLRILRFCAFFISMFLPSLYIAITTFHQEMLPTPLLISLAAQREGVPFPAILEALLMEITFEVLREAGVRMPRVIGPAISIVGALVLGQAAVQAGLVSAAMIIVVSFTAISNFVIPALNMAIAARLLRFGMMILGGTLGLFGIMSGMMILLIHLVSLRSFGISYMTPFSPIVWPNLKDTLVRVPWWLMKKRPALISNPRQAVRNASGQRPSPRRKKRP